MIPQDKCSCPMNCQLHQPMTAEERAEKIVTKFNSEGASLSNTDETYLQELIVNQIKQAEEAARAELENVLKSVDEYAKGQYQAYDERRMSCVAHAKESYCPECEFDFKRGEANGFSLAREMAAKMAENYSKHLPVDIRAMRAEDSK